MVQHSAIDDPNIHEPKGASSAAINTAYIATGAGSGSWRKVDSLALKGLAGDGASTNLRLVSDGSNGFVFKTAYAYGSMVMNNNTNNFAVTAVADTTLNTAAQYVLFTGTGAPLASENLFGVTFTTDRLIAPVAGVYEIFGWSNVTGFPSATSKVGLRYRINGAGFSARFAMVKSGVAGDVCNMGFSELVTLAAGEYVQLYVASDATGNLIIQNLDFTINLVRPT